jgi:hypothetical protein
MREILTSDFWDWLTIGSVVIGFVACVAFVIRYQIEVGRSWWRLPDGTVNHFGRYLMVRKVLLASLFGLILTNRVIGSWEARPAFTAILMFAFAVHTFVPYRLLISAQRAQEKQEARNDER